MPATHRLLSPKSPWVHLLPLRASQTAESVLAPPPGLLVKTLDGRRCRTKGPCLEALARLWSFPDYFDPNWDALEECLTDLEWLPADGYLLLIQHADALLTDATPEDRRTLLQILRGAGRHWGAPTEDRPAKPFRTLLVAATNPATVRTRWGIPLWSGPRTSRPR